MNPVSGFMLTTVNHSLWQYNCVTPMQKTPSGLKDRASVPRRLWWFIAPAGRHAQACVVHDFMYENAVATKSQAGALFYEGLRELHVPAWRVRLMYWMVRLFGRGGDAFNNAMLLPSVWCDEYIWSFQTGVNEYFYGDTIAVNCFPVWRFKRRDRDTVFKCSVSLWASLSEGLLVLGLRMDAIEGPLDAVPLEKLMASPKGGVTMWKRNRFRWFWTEWTRLHPISFRMWKDRFTEEGYFDWPEAAFPEERRLCLSVELGLPARSLYEKTSPSGDGEAESHGGLFRIQRRRSCCR